MSKVSNSPPPHPKRLRPIVSHNGELVGSLLTLNNNCILEIFECLDVATLCRMANVCKRFRALAEIGYRHRYRIDCTQTYGHDALTFRQVQCKFGQFILKIDAEFLPFVRQIDADLLNKYCPNLMSLCCNTRIFTCNADRPLFTRLNHLDLYLCKFNGNANKLFENCLQLQDLKFAGDLTTFKNVFLKKFPILNEIEINLFSQDGTIEFRTFLQLNPQLEHLSQINPNLNDTSISAIVTHVPHLKALKLLYFPFGRRIQDEDGLMEPNLNSFNNIDKYRIIPLLKSLLNANICLESLELYGVAINPLFIETIAEFKTINTLALGSIDYTAIDLIPFATQLSFLKRIHIGAYHHPDLQISIFTDAIRNANILIEEISFKLIKIDAMAVVSLIKLKSLQKLILWVEESFREQYLVLLAGELPQLTELKVGTLFNSAVNITERALIKAVQNGKRLRTFHVIDLVHIHISKNTINSLISAAKIGETNRTLIIYVSGNNISREEVAKSKYEIESTNHRLKLKISL